jgi:hypothetical protein
METKAQLLPATTVKKHAKKVSTKLIMTPSGYSAEKRSKRVKKLPPRLGGVDG